MNEDTDIYEKVKQLEKLVCMHANILQAIASILAMAGYVKDAQKDDNDAD